ncbi:MAG: methyltransferase domain-containing protein [Acidimicrobiales bacterium]|nr:methyltransferase domain-containing protein [Acidimicrobiales bacterium]
MGASAWDPVQYRRFAAERAAPFDDLLTMAGPGRVRRLVDLGCGPGELTVRAARRLGADDTLGIDHSPEMLAAAAAHADDGVRFAIGDLGVWTSDGDVDVVLASASLQWVPDHPAVLERWARALAPGGRLLVQVPANAGSVTHRLAAEVAAREPFHAAFGPDGPPADPVAGNVLAPEAYARVLHDLGLVHQEVVLRVYPHLLDSVHDAVEWVKGTTLTRFARRLPADLYDHFLEVYERELLERLGDRRPLFFPFPRILFRAQRPG